ncbi:MAG: peptidoglycan-binding domain-containing protein [Candidatus Omnitrophica bacterium]|nr:peptidoglycan-binding domain-containing protein [Candidatus Omnitrophota bacterium]
MRRLVYLLVPILVLSAAGCASTKSAKPKKDLKTRVTELEARVDEMESQSSASTQAASEQYAYSQPAVKASPVVQAEKYLSAGVAMTKKEIQTALKNAGHYAGAIDGVFGPKTKQAVKDFQADKGLKVDGIVGPQTEKALQKHL